MLKRKEGQKDQTCPWNIALAKPNNTKISENNHVPQCGNPTHPPSLSGREGKSRVEEAQTRKHSGHCRAVKECYRGNTQNQAPYQAHTKKVEDLSSSKIMYTLKLIHNQFKNKKVKKTRTIFFFLNHKITIFQKHEFSSNIKIYNPKIVVVVDHFYIALFSVLEQTSALLSHAILNSK